MKKKAIIIGAGPAGLTAAFELLQRTDIVPIILEKTSDIGGISKTMNFQGNRMDMGPHRFFSKSDRVMDWWLSVMPLDPSVSMDQPISYHHQSRLIVDPCSYAQKADSSGRQKTMLIIPRLTRIYFLRKFFAYPIKLSLETLRALGGSKTAAILFSFLRSRIWPRQPESNLEDFLINRFGKELYLLFFKDYTEKVWGKPCHEIAAEWGAQRIKGLSLSKAILSAARSLRPKHKRSIEQKEIETSLIEQFLYPKYGTGSMWEEVARIIEDKGGKIYFNRSVTSVYTTRDNNVCSIHSTNTHTGELELFEGDYFFSSMPVKELVAAIASPMPDNIHTIARGLEYRDFINVGVLLRRLSRVAEGSGERQTLELKDNWMYIQERDVKVGRLMIYNNWGSEMVKDPATTWIGMEYFCNASDDFWRQNDKEIEAIAIEELVRLNLAAVEDVMAITVKRMEKTYPAYFGTYPRFAELREWINGFSNLYLIGRNGMHKYNNADHSMLTAMVAVDNIIAGITAKDNIWAVNTEQEYHEEKTTGPVHDDIRHSAPRQEKPVGGLPPGLIPSFLPEIWKKNRAYLALSPALFLLQFLWFKMRYPFANYMPDSYSYLEAAYSNQDVNMWPVAYSKFLRFFSVFTHSDKILVAFQYFFLQGATVVFIFTLVTHLKIPRQMRFLLLAFILVNPAPLYISNYISADALFISLSLLWMASLTLVIARPLKSLVFIHALLLLGCFTVRYNAIYYPVVSFTAFMLSRLSVTWKVAALALAAALIGYSYMVTSSEMKMQTGTRQFSAFGGWQLANNALYMYETVPADRRTTVPFRFAALNKTVLQHFDTLSKVKLSAADSANGYFYLWSHKGPLYAYLFNQYKSDSTTPFFKRWASESPLYLAYAKFLIARFPFEYARTFVLPNLVKFVVPPAEFLAVYNMGSDSVRPIAKTWFNYSSLQVLPHAPKLKKGEEQPKTLMNHYASLAGIINIFLVFCLIAAAATRQLIIGRKENSQKILLLLLLFYFVNMGFSLVAAPIVLRYQAFPLLISIMLTAVYAGRVYRYLVEKDLQDKLKANNLQSLVT